MKQNHSILIAEDNDDIREMLQTLLESEGYTTFVASDGLAALEILRSGVRPSLILTDLQMPNLDGAELAQIAATEFRHIPLILMSGHNTIEQEKLKKLRVRSFVGKPFAIDFLLACIRDYIELQDILSPSA